MFKSAFARKSAALKAGLDAKVRQAINGRLTIFLATAVASLVSSSEFKHGRRLKAALEAPIWGAVVSYAMAEIRSGQRRSVQEMRALWRLQGIMPSGQVWPALGDWALSASALSNIVDQISARNSCDVVELGPGSSSILLALAFPKVRFYGLEHDKEFFSKVGDHLKQHEIDNFTLVYAPLDTSLPTTPWYNEVALGRLPPKIDLLVVDGPPNWDGSGARANALPALAGHLHSGAIIVVDDTNRRSERKMVKSWIKDFDLELVADSREYMVLAVKHDIGKY